MAHPIWPLFDLVVTTPRLELRVIDDEFGTELALLAANGIHDPGFMPFAFPWTDVASPELERNTMRFYWRTRAEITPASWMLNFAVIVDGAPVGSTGLITTDFAITRVFETGSWLGREHQGHGIGKEMRLATLQLGFLGFGGRFATTSAFDDNGPSLGVTHRLGYTPIGHRRRARRGEPATTLDFEMSRAHWQTHLRRDDIVLSGVEECLPLLGLAEPPAVQ